MIAQADQDIERNYNVSILTPTFQEYRYELTQNPCAEKSPCQPGPWTAEEVNKLRAGVGLFAAANWWAYVSEFNISVSYYNF